MIRTAFSMLAGTIALSGYNIADTYFVAQMGVEPLAAMGFTFPIIMIMDSIFFGISAGVMTTVAQALGAGKKKKASLLIISGLILTAVTALLTGLIGWLTIDVLFSHLGAQGETLVLVRQYMTVMYLFSVVMALVCVTNDLLIACGSARSASFLMCISLIINIILDPLFIFEWGFFPGWGITGAAWASIISQLLATLASLWILGVRHKLLSVPIKQWRLIRNAWKKIVHLSLPVIIGMELIPLGTAAVVKATSTFGDPAVAASAAAGRLEMAAFFFPMALGVVLMPMVAQNFGAKLYQRIRQCRRFAMRFALVYLLSISILFSLFAPWLSSFFSDDAQVLRIMTLYLRIVSWGFCAIEIHRYGTFFFVGCNHAKSAAMFTIFRVIFCLIPFTLIAMYVGWLPGIFIARLSADVLSGIVAWAAAKYMTDKLANCE